VLWFPIRHFEEIEHALEFVVENQMPAANWFVLTVTPTETIILARMDWNVTFDSKIQTAFVSAVSCPPVARTVTGFQFPLQFEFENWIRDAEELLEMTFIPDVIIVTPMRDIEGVAYKWRIQRPKQRLLSDHRKRKMSMIWDC